MALSLLYLCDQVDALSRRVGYELRHPNALLRREVEVHMRRPVPFKLSQHFSGRVSQHLLCSRTGICNYGGGEGRERAFHTINQHCC